MPRRSAEPVKSKPYVVASVDLAKFGDAFKIPPDELASHLETITRLEGPVQLRVATRRIAKAIGVPGNKKVEWLVKQAARFAKVRIESDFLYPPSYSFRPIRDHSTAPKADRKLSFVPPEEIEEAILEVVRNSFKMTEDETLKPALTLLGFKKLTTKARERMRQALSSLIDSGRVASHDGILEIPPSDA